MGSNAGNESNAAAASGSAASASNAAGAGNAAGNGSAGAAAVAERMRALLQERFGPSPEGGSPEEVFVARAPGRLNLIGGHTDYSEGLVLPATIDRAAYVAVRQRAGGGLSGGSDGEVRLYAEAFDEEARYRLSGGPPRKEGWASYAGGVADALLQDGRLGKSPGGFEGVVAGDVPLGAGLSSSAALTMATATALEALFAGRDGAPGPLGGAEMARLGQRVEHEYAGVECGIMDPFAVRLGRSGHALFLDCRSLEHEHVPLLLQERAAALVVADSGVRRELAASKYNERRRECQQAAARLREHTGEAVETLRDATPEMVEAAGGALSEPLRSRARHVTSENQRVVEAKGRLEEGDLEALGQLMNASHAGLREDYEVSSPELDALAEAARETEGVYGARMTGAGFGGCTVTLAERGAAVERFKERARQRFAEDFPGRQPPAFYVIEENIETGLLR